MKFKIDVYNQIRDENLMVKSEECIHSAIYETEDTLDEVVSGIRNREGIAIDIIETDDEIPLIRFESLIGESGQDTVDYLNNKHRLVSKDQSDFTFISNTSHVLSISEVDFMPEADLAELRKLMNEELRVEIGSVTKKESIYEWGASGLLIDFLLNLAAGFTQSGIEKKINSFLKSKGHENASVAQFDLRKVKTFIEENYQINPNTLKLTSTRTYEDGRTTLNFSSRYKDYHITIDKDENVIESSVRQLGQTGI